MRSTTCINLQNSVVFLYFIYANIDMPKSVSSILNSNAMLNDFVIKDTKKFMEIFIYTFT